MVRRACSTISSRSALATPWRQPERVRCRPPTSVQYVGADSSAARLERRLIADAVDAKLRRAHDVDRRKCDTRVGQRCAQPLCGGLRLKQQRIVRLHAQDELHAAIQVESELEGTLYWINDPERECDDADDDEHTIASARAENEISVRMTDPPVHTKTHL